MGSNFQCVCVILEYIFPSYNERISTLNASPCIHMIWWGNPLVPLHAADVRYDSISSHKYGHVNNVAHVCLCHHVKLDWCLMRSGVTNEQHDSYSPLPLPSTKPTNRMQQFPENAARGRHFAGPLVQPTSLSYYPTPRVTLDTADTASLIVTLLLLVACSKSAALRRAHKTKASTYLTKLFGAQRAL